MSDIRRALKKLLFGSSTFSRFRPIGLRDLQSRIGVWLHGWGSPLDVTYSNVMAAGKPLTLGIGMDRQFDSAAIHGRTPTLKFVDNHRKGHLLGEICLKFRETIPVGDRWLHLFQPQSSANYCLPRIWLWSRCGYYLWKDRLAPKSSIQDEIQITFKEVRSHWVFYICPRPVVLASAAAGEMANIFPLDLMGPIGGRRFSLALHSTSTAVPLVERARRIALSSVPIEQRAVAYMLGRNHKQPCADWDHLPFATSASPAFGLPVPQFSLRVREMEIETVQAIGQYKLFIANMIEERVWADGLQFFQIHGFCESLVSSEQA